MARFATRIDGERAAELFKQFRNWTAVGKRLGCDGSVARRSALRIMRAHGASAAVAPGLVPTTASPARTALQEA